MNSYENNNGYVFGAGMLFFYETSLSHYLISYCFVLPALFYYFPFNSFLFLINYLNQLLLKAFLLLFVKGKRIVGSVKCSKTSTKGKLNVCIYLVSECIYFIELFIFKYNKNAYL